MMHRNRKWMFFPFVIAGFLLAASGAVMWLWNAILPDVTGAKRISFWQAGGLLALCRILVGGFGGGRGGGGPKRFGPPMSDNARKRWHTMNGDERDQFRKAWRERCGKWRGQSEQQ